METHNRLRKKLCLICCDRADRDIPESLVPTIKEYLIWGYALEYPKLPGGLCSSCRISLNSMKNGNFDVLLPDWYDFSSMANFHFPRDGSDCDCHLCQKAREQRTWFGRRPKHSSKTRNPGRRKSEADRPGFFVLCGTCLTPCESEELNSHRCRQGGAKLAAAAISSQVPDGNKKRLAYELINSELQGKFNL